MECEACKGTGKSAKKGPCFFCNGTGAKCDVCGEAVNEAGANLCRECEKEAGRQQIKAITGDIDAEVNDMWRKGYVFDFNKQQWLKETKGEK